MDFTKLQVASKKTKEILAYLKVLSKDMPVAEFENTLKCVASSYLPPPQ